ncbi:MAG: hypothetical protein KBA66_01110 [Leptospiraceae bacterium]|nr:hypothetical protein [Leptospiraceae bacterium]
MRYLMIVILFFLYSCDPENWSGNLGRKDWADAKAHCESIGMRLASNEEWVKENRLRKIREFWKVDYPFFYWTSQEEKNEKAFVFDTMTSSIHSKSKTKTALVRCIR